MNAALFTRRNLRPARAVASDDTKYRRDLKGGARRTARTRNMPGAPVSAAPAEAAAGAGAAAGAAAADAPPKDALPPPIAAKGRGLASVDSFGDPVRRAGPGARGLTAVGLARAGGLTAAPVSDPSSRFAQCAHRTASAVANTRGRIAVA
jgi:hypothetical protein